MFAVDTAEGPQRQPRNKGRLAGQKQRLFRPEATTVAGTSASRSMTPLRQQSASSSEQKIAAVSVPVGPREPSQPGAFPLHEQVFWEPQVREFQPCSHGKA